MGGGAGSTCKRRRHSKRGRGGYGRELQAQLDGAPMEPEKATGSSGQRRDAALSGGAGRVATPLLAEAGGSGSSSAARAPGVGRSFKRGAASVWGRARAATTSSAATTGGGDRRRRHAGHVGADGGTSPAALPTPVVPFFFQVVYGQRWLHVTLQGFMPYTKVLRHAHAVAALQGSDRGWLPCTCRGSRCGWLEVSRSDGAVWRRRRAVACPSGGCARGYRTAGGGVFVDAGDVPASSRRQ